MLSELVVAAAGALVVRASAELGELTNPTFT